MKKLILKWVSKFKNWKKKVKQRRIELKGFNEAYSRVYKTPKFYLVFLAAFLTFYVALNMFDVAVIEVFGQWSPIRNILDFITFLLLAYVAIRFVDNYIEEEILKPKGYSQYSKTFDKSILNDGQIKEYLKENPNVIYNRE